MSPVLCVVLCVLRVVFVALGVKSSVLCLMRCFLLIVMLCVVVYCRVLLRCCVLWLVDVGYSMLLCIKVFCCALLGAVVCRRAL